jgi:integrase/recombinase XerC
MNESGFSNYLQYEKRFSAHTVQAYLSDLDQFQQFLLAHYQNEEPRNLRGSHVRSWVAALMGEGLSPVSIRRKISTLKTYFRFLLREGQIERSPMQQVSLPKTGERLPSVVSEKAMSRLLDDQTWPEDYQAQRDRLILELLYHTGIRQGELLTLRLADVDLYQSRLHIKGKGGKERLVPFGKSLVTCLQAYLAQRNAQFPNGAADTLFLSDKGKPMYAVMLNRIVKRYLASAGPLEKRSPHVLRHSFATHLSEHGADLNAIKELLGHNSLAATQIYTHNSVERLKEIYRQAHPKGS